MIRTVPRRSRLKSILVFLFFLANKLTLNLLPFDATGAEPPKQILSAKISLKVKWDKKDGSDNRRHGQMKIRIQGLLKLNKQFSSLEIQILFRLRFWFPVVTGSRQSNQITLSSNA